MNRDTSQVFGRLDRFSAQDEDEGYQITTLIAEMRQRYERSPDDFHVSCEYDFSSETHETALGDCYVQRAATVTAEERFDADDNDPESVGTTIVRMRDKLRPMYKRTPYWPHIRTMRKLDDLARLLAGDTRDVEERYASVLALYVEQIAIGVVVDVINSNAWLLTNNRPLHYEDLVPGSIVIGRIPDSEVARATRRGLRVQEIFSTLSKTPLYAVSRPDRGDYSEEITFVLNWVSAKTLAMLV